MSGTSTVSGGMSNVPWRKSGLLSELPPPSQDRKGWPWTRQSNPLPELMPGGEPWPKISIVTPSYNQGQFLEETIRSVLLQNYPNLEYIVMDGGSTDESVSIIREYEPWLTYWVSEKDTGQVDAINRGISLCSGCIVSWLNSDDIYLKNALKNVAQAFSKSGIELIVGERYNITEDGFVINRQTIGHRNITNFQVLYMGRWPFYQESVFFSKDLWEIAGCLSDKYSMLFDFEFFVRCLKHTHAVTLPGQALGCWRHHSLQKINPERMPLVNNELTSIYKTYRSAFATDWLLRLLWSIGKRTVWRNDKVQEMNNKLPPLVGEEKNVAVENL